MHRLGNRAAAFDSCGLRVVSAVLVVLCLAACATTRELPTTEARLTNPADAVLIPPPGGPAISTVVTSTFPNAIVQDISLITEARTAGENKISVIMFEGRGGDGSDTRLRDIPFTQVNLTEEALAAWPNSGMSVSPYYVQNAYGPFGYAIGKPGNGDTCIYAWQRIEPGLKPSGAIERGAIILRLQLCQMGASEQQLLQVMYQLRFDAGVFPPGRAPSRIGAISAPIVPVGAQGFADVIPSAPVVVQRAPVRAAPVAQAPAVPARPPIVTPPPGAPIVPPPGGTRPATNSSGSGPRVPAPPGGGGALVPSPSAGSI